MCFTNGKQLTMNISYVIRTLVNEVEMYIYYHCGKQNKLNVEFSGTVSSKK